MGFGNGNFSAGPGKSRNFLGYDVGGGHNDAKKNKKNIFSLDFICIYEKLLASRSLPQTP